MGNNEMMLGVYVPTSDSRSAITPEVAASAIQAAEQACGERLRSAGHLGELRAEVWVGKPDRKESYYST